MYLLAIVTSSYFGKRSMIYLEERFLPLQKDLQFVVESEDDQRMKRMEEMINNLEAHVRKLENENKQSRRDLAELKCKHIPVQVNLTH